MIMFLRILRLLLPKQKYWLVYSLNLRKYLILRQIFKPENTNHSATHGMIVIDGPIHTREESIACLKHWRDQLTLVEEK